MPAPLTAADFRRAMAPPIVLQTPTGPVELRVLQVSERSPAPGLAAGFSVLLGGPHEPPLPQATYAASHPELGEFPFFIVPVGVEPDGFRYEAVFTRLDS